MTAGLPATECDDVQVLFLVGHGDPMKLCPASYRNAVDDPPIKLARGLRIFTDGLIGASQSRRDGLHATAPHDSKYRRSQMRNL